MSDRFFLLSGCSGGGKSSLLAELRRRGERVVEEPGRRIVAAELETAGSALPWVDLAAFARRAIEVALADLAEARRQPGRVFFDRGIVDAACALQWATGEPVLETLGPAHRYNPAVFLAPPWPEIFAADAERRHGLDAAVAEYGRLRRAFAQLHYRPVELPKRGVAERADFVLSHLAAGIDRSPDGSAGPG